MKYIKLTFLFVFSPCFLFSQILETDDFDIFFESFTTIDDTDFNFSDKTYNNYIVFQREFHHLFFDILNDLYDGGMLTNETFNNIKRQYQQYMKINVPTEIDKIYRSMGFNNNGHQKYCVLSFGTNVWAFLLITGNQEITKLLELFGENDLEIIKNGYEKYIVNNND
jgi:hypothetical protein